MAYIKGRTERAMHLTLLFRDAFAKPWATGNEADAWADEINSILDLEYRQGMKDGAETAIKAIKKEMNRTENDLY